MPAVGALLDSRAAVGALRRSIPAGSAQVVSCRSAAGLERLLAERLLEAVVLGVRALREIDFPAFRCRYPGIPVIAYGVMRSDDADLLRGWHRLEVAAVVIEGVDDPVVGDLVMRHSVTARRRAALADAGRMLRLTEPLQQRAWALMIGTAGKPPKTSDIARRLGLSREHLSRQFAAGGAPNLKRVADLITVLSALSLLRNPAYQLPAVALLLGLRTPRHVRALVRRISGVGMAEAQELSETDVLRRFQRGSRRSRA